MRRSLSILLVLAFLLAGAPAAWAQGSWQTQIDQLVAGKAIGVAVREEGRFLYRHASKKKRVPASNQKLLLSMALFDAFDTDRTFDTAAASTSFPNAGVIEGDLWVLGHGDPTITGGASYGRSLPFDATRLGSLARNIKAAGITAVRGRVLGNTGFFAHDWYAPGWKPDFAERYVPLPSALTFEGNVHRGDHITDPEERTAGSLTRKLEKIGVKVTGRPGSGEAPAALVDIAKVSSQPLSVMARFMNRRSSNFFAEVFGKRLGIEYAGIPGTIAKGAAAIAAWAARRSVSVISHDSSGLSYENKVAPGGLVRLLGFAEDQPWGETLRTSLPGPDEGTLEDRLNGVRVRAKTGTLTDISSLSGYVWLRRVDTWAEFSILSRGLSKTHASAIEDDIVRILTREGR